MLDSQGFRAFVAFISFAGAFAVTGCKQQSFAPATQLNADCVGRVNDLGMGADCTLGNEACLGTPAPVCSADYSAAKPAICTLPCDSDSDCGTRSTCQHDAASGVSLCMPAACFTRVLTSATAGNANTCPPTGANSAGVGAPCAKGGNECAATPAPFCTVDYAAVPAAFCTKTCTSDAECGPGASCAGESGVSLRACVPNACLAAAESSDTLPGNGNVSGVCPPPAANNVGVGKACTRAGNQCKSTPSPYCSVDYIATPYAFCTRTCDSTRDCGTGASCQADPGGSGLKACIPTSCEAAVETDPNAKTQTCAGNSRGVGKTCTAGGRQCDHVQASLCTADVDPRLPGVCTKFCTNNASCGTDATCVSSSHLAGLAVCVPTSTCVNPE